MVGSGLLNTVVLTQDTLIETVHGDRDDNERSFMCGTTCHTHILIIETCLESCTVRCVIWLVLNNS